MAEAPQWGHLVQHPCSGRAIPENMAQDSTETVLTYLQWASGAVHKIISEVHLLPFLLNIKVQEQPKTCTPFAIKCTEIPWSAKMTIPSQRYSVWEYSLTVSRPVMDTSPQNSFLSAQWTITEIRQTLTSTCYCKTVKISDLESWVIRGHRCLQTEVPISKHQPPAGTFVPFLHH